MLATACDDGKVRVFNLPTSTVSSDKVNSNAIKVFTGHTQKVFSVKWSPIMDGVLCSCSDDW